MVATRMSALIAVKKFRLPAIADPPSASSHSAVTGQTSTVFDASSPISPWYRWRLPEAGA
jgi:hypothetical protein